VILPAGLIAETIVACAVRAHKDEQFTLNKIGKEPNTCYGEWGKQNPQITVDLSGTWRDPARSREERTPLLEGAVCRYFLNACSGIARAKGGSESERNAVFLPSPF
jgi:hypothetical protein